MPIGPSLPPHTTKRAREDDENHRSASPESGEKRRRVLGPAPPPARSRSDSEDSDIGPTPPPASKPARVLGPAPPPAPLDERPPNPPSDDSDSSDDDFGPAPPPAGASSASYNDQQKTRSTKSAFDTDPQYSEENKKVQRDSWMTMPPTQDDLSRMDPTKMRARKFNTGKSAGGGGGGSMDVWTETPEQKLKRLQDEAMGISAHSNSSTSKKELRRNREEEEKAQKLREKIDGSRGKSLVEQHQAKGGKEKEDDPSKRVFDYGKDMSLGTKVSHKQKREMLNKAKGFSDRFSSGSYL
ncbi:uncharacterized protein N0V89_011524 [Didymosphaeria variabile]|uniref:DUF3752 domain-containing protein n=1 Tax=Didymosphaeria variabile TaxID=1932322 RepID=A0A9W9C5T5_9PLEO|nr:uncharacterized protein N0V89_011524 [Didymosphaeria variabile]KAJ4345394.1 hypothetical protein N0V89_011524 [Didymosphaeria variabile]